MAPYFDPEVETASPEKLREIQFRKLKKLLEVVSNSNPFYQKKFQKHGVRVEEIRSVEDIRKLPISYKEEYLLDQEQNPPFGTNLSESLEHFIRYHQTTGTTGIPLKWLETRESWQWRRKIAAMAVRAAGVLPTDIAFFAFSFGPHAAFWGLMQGVQEIGALVISGGGWDTAQRVRCIMENQVTVLCCTPTYALRIAEVAKEKGIDLKGSSLRLMIVGGEPGALIPSVRKKVIEATGARPYDYSGLTEIGAYGFQCQYQENAIHVIESEFVLEILDPKTGEPVPEGELGEMVLTNLGRIGSPTIRFHTNDLVRVKKGLCPCGRTFRMLDGGVLGRADDMITIRGLNIFPSEVGQIVERHLEVGDEYQMVAFTRKGMGEFKVTLELMAGGNHQEVVRALEDDLRNSFEIRMEIDVVPPGTLPRFEYKSKRFIDKREERSLVT
ncbi:MAG: AMP-binding protein [Desulfobacteraceae bacterium]|jgi:phenylacetate-CoA ligase